MPDHTYIRVQNAREHNLRDVCVDIPRDKLVVITGVSGSGKSSLAFDTIYAEGQRRYVESLSSYARQFLGIMEKPDVDLIEGLSPAISIEQKTTHRNPRSTVGTVTEIYDYLRLLFARVGNPYCHICDRPVETATVDEIVDKVKIIPVGQKIIIMAPLVSNQKGTHAELFEKLRKENHVRVRVNKIVYRLDENIKLAKNKRHTIELIVDRLIVKNESAQQSRISQSVELALENGNGNVAILTGDQEDEIQLNYSQKLYCKHCEVSLPDISPTSFSFNSPSGACATCDGLGVLLEFDENLVVPNPGLSLLDGAIAPWGGPKNSWHIQTIHDLAKGYDFDPYRPFERLPKKIKKLLLYGSASIDVSDDYFEGVIPNLARRFHETKSDDMRLWMEKYQTNQACNSCQGFRLRPESLAVRFHNHRIQELTNLHISALLEFFNTVVLDNQDLLIAERILKELKERLGFLTNVGVGYLNLARSAGTLSGGEAQRIRLATQIGSALMGVLYVLDEPSIGLHQRDNDKLLKTLKGLRDMGNTVLVVEHDEDTIRQSDYVLDLGPGAGVHGGNVVASGTPTDIEKNKNSLTGMFLSGQKSIPVPDEIRNGNGHSISIKKASQNNLKNIDIDFPLGKLIAITGVSGSGKSTLVVDILLNGISRKLGLKSNPPGMHGKITGLENIDKVVAINQEPIGRTPRSNPATYTGLFTPIRDLFANLPEAKLRGYRAGRFSFNVRGGRCENCEGAGIIKIEMHFLPDVYVPCDICDHKRFNRETLEVRYKHKNIYDVLDMTVEEALLFFENIPSVKKKLQTLSEVGLEYIKLGQAATTLSGGEAQRVKLSTELSKRSTGKTLYILDEPTTGLHFEDINKLLSVLHSLVDRGNSMVIIEHNLDVIKTADHIIDLGPEGGDGGGEVIVEGTPADIIKSKKSFTGKFLKKLYHKN